MIDTVCTFFGITASLGTSDSRASQQRTGEEVKPSAAFRFSEGQEPGPKEFLHGKQPVTDIERVACLAYYLTHFRSMRHFKTKDISELNREAAQRPFSNAAFAVVNATNGGMLVPSIKGAKQLSASGEQFVQALPDRQAAREALDRVKWRRTRRRSPDKAGATA